MITMEISNDIQNQLLIIYSIMLGIIFLVFCCSLFGIKDTFLFIIFWLIPHEYERCSTLKSLFIYIFQLFIVVILVSSFWFTVGISNIIAKSLFGNDDFVLLQLITNLPTIILIIFLIKENFKK